MSKRYGEPDSKEDDKGDKEEGMMKAVLVLCSSGSQVDVATS